MVNEALLSLLVCPLGKAPLRREGETLICTRCGPRFSIKDDIPNMLIEEAELPLAAARWPTSNAFDPAKPSSIDHPARLRAGFDVGACGSKRLTCFFRRRDVGGCSRQQHDRRSSFDRDRIAGLHLTALAQLDLAVDPDLAAGDQHLGLAAALGTAAELEHLGQVDRPVVERDGTCWEVFFIVNHIILYQDYSKIGVSFASTSSTIASGTLSSFLPPRAPRSSARAGRSG